MYVEAKKKCNELLQEIEVVANKIQIILKNDAIILNGDDIRFVKHIESAFSNLNRAKEDITIALKSD